MSQGTGTGTPATAAAEPQSFVIIRDWQPGQVVRVVFLTPAQAAALPNIPADALQIAIAPAGGMPA